MLPLHWSGEPFSYEGRHFSAHNIIARPRPVQSPIPIWIGGNSKLTRRRVAERAQGWMPMSGGAQLSTTARTQELGPVEQLAGQIAEVRESALAAGRTDHIDVVYSYSSEIGSSDIDPDRHREVFADLEKAGVDWVTVSCGIEGLSATVEFLESFGATYLS